MAKLKDQHERFCQEYLIDLNQTQAAIRAGYSSVSARVTASRLLTNANIQDRIAELKAVRSEKLDIDAMYVLKRHYDIDQMDVLDIHNEDGSIKPLRDWPKIWRQYISGIELSELFEGSGDDKKMIGLLKKIKWPDKVKNLELLGKHVEIQAYKEKSDVTHSGAITTYTQEDYEKAKEKLSGKFDDLD